MLKRGEDKSVPNMKGALSVDDLILADTMLYQSKQKLKETQGQFLPQCGHLFVKCNVA